MKRLRLFILPSLLILALSAGLGFAQVINKAIQLSQDASGAFGVDTTNNVYFPGHILSTGTAHAATTIGTCGTSPTIIGTDVAGVATTGSTATTSCVITFGRAYVTAPSCVVAGGTSMATTAALLATATTTTLTVTYASSTSAKINYVCVSLS